MGNFVSTTECEITISAKNVEKAFQKLCAINSHPAYAQYKTSVDWEGDKTTPCFDGLAVDYDKTAKTLEDITDTALGFKDSYYDDKGNFHFGIFNNDSGAETLILSAIAPFVEDGSYSVWVDEYNDMWRIEFHNGEISILYPKGIVWS